MILIQNFMIVLENYTSEICRRQYEKGNKKSKKCNKKMPRLFLTSSE